MLEPKRRRPLALLTLIGVLWGAPAHARESGEPQRFHVVYAGQRLTSIAKRYNVSVEAIRTANGLAKNARLKPGEKLTIPGLDDPDGTRARTLYPPQRANDLVVPASTRADKGDKVDKDDRDQDSDADDDGPRTHKVYSGQRLESIAKRYKVSVDALCAANGITRRSTLRAGQVLLIPQPGDSISSLEADFSRQGKLPHLGIGKGYVDLFTYSGHFRGYALDKKGKVTPTAQSEVSKLFGATGTRPETDPRLIRLLAKVSHHFGSRPIRIVSGYRTRSFFEDSRHKLSRAVDFSIPGIDNVTLRDYLRTLSSVGVGYYPNSSFVHLDVRDANTYWVDYAGPGEAPRKTNARDHGHDHDREADGDLQDPEVSEGDRTGEAEPPTLAAPASALAPSALPVSPDSPDSSAVKPALGEPQNTPK
ncbi:MAG TPA: LysM peptidoglycan-binding domain-containing protein [Polyangiaceae bacterium]|nr:LysM peptidoglycan-binding domain-containing protein [Polyangiaceae bacterium]